MTSWATANTNSFDSTALELTLTDSTGTTVFNGLPAAIPEHTESKLAAIGCPVGIGTAQAAQTPDKRIQIEIKDATGTTIIKYKGLQSAIPDDIVAKLVELGYPVDQDGKVVLEAPHPPQPPKAPEFGLMPQPPQAPMPPMPPLPPMPSFGHLHMAPPQPPQPPMPPQVPGGSQSQHFFVKRDGNRGGNVKVVIQSA